MKIKKFVYPVCHIRYRVIFHTIKNTPSFKVLFSFNSKSKPGILTERRTHEVCGTHGSSTRVYHRHTKGYYDLNLKMCRKRSYTHRGFRTDPLYLGLTIRILIKTERGFEH